MVQLHTGYIFGSAGGSGLVREGAVEEGKLERLTQAQHGHRSFWLLLCSRSLISCTCTLVVGISAQREPFHLWCTVIIDHPQSVS